MTSSDALSRVLVCDSITAQKYGQVKNLLREKGRPIPENDIWTAATAKQLAERALRAVQLQDFTGALIGVTPRGIRNRD